MVGVQPVEIHERMPLGLETVRIGTAGPVDLGAEMPVMDAPIGAVAPSEEAQRLVSSEDAEKLRQHVHVDMEVADSGLALPVDIVAEKRAEEEAARQADEGTGSGVISKIARFAGEHPVATVGLGVAGGAVGINAASAAVSPATAKATFEWEAVGGDPFVDGGIHSEEQLEGVLKSPRGREALRDQGLNGREIRRVISAATNEPGKGDASRDIRDCSLNPGDDFDTMVFGDSGVIASDVVYTGSPEEAKCIDVKMPNGKVINVKIPIGCANIAIDSMMRKPPKKPPTHKPPTGNLVLTKAFEDANGNPLSISGTDWRASCVVKGVGRVTNTFEYNPSERRGPVTAIRGCKVGKVATMMELTSPEDLAHWDVLTGKPVVKNGQIIGFVQKQKVDRGRNLFGFKNRQKRPARPDQPGEQIFLPPSISIASWDHIKTGDIQEICSFESDADNDIASTVFTENGNGFFTTDPNHPYLGDEAGEKCVKYAAGSLGQEGATITATVTDRRNQSASATEVFDIVGSEDPRGEF